MRLWSTLRHRPAGNLRFTSKVHLPARPAMSFKSFTRTLHRRLAPPMSIRATLSLISGTAPARNCPAFTGVFISLAVSAFSTIGSHRRLHILTWRRLSLRFCNRPSYPLANPAIPARFLAGSSVGPTVLPFNLWKQVQKSIKSVIITKASATNMTF